MGLVRVVTSYQCFIHARNKLKQGEIALFFTKYLIRVLFLDVTTKVIQKMPELCTEYPSSLAVSGKEKMDQFCHLSVFMLVSLANEPRDDVTK